MERHINARGNPRRSDDVSVINKSLVPTKFDRRIKFEEIVETVPMGGRRTIAQESCRRKHKRSSADACHECVCSRLSSDPVELNLVYEVSASPLTSRINQHVELRHFRERTLRDQRKPFRALNRARILSDCDYSPPIARPLPGPTREDFPWAHRVKLLHSFKEQDADRSLRLLHAKASRPQKPTCPRSPALRALVPLLQSLRGVHHPGDDPPVLANLAISGETELLVG